MQGKNRDTYTGRSWLGRSRVGGGWCGGGDGQCININKRGARSQWEEIQVTVCQSRVHRRLWGGGLFSHDGCMNSMVAMDVWVAIDRRYEVICWVERKRDAASWWWWQMVCGDVALMWQQVRTNKRSFREKNGVLELVHVAENDQQSSREGDHKKTSKKSPP